jgi:hypothetical protein
MCADTSRFDPNEGAAKEPPTAADGAVDPPAAAEAADAAERAKAAMPTPPPSPLLGSRTRAAAPALDSYARLALWLSQRIGRGEE